MKLDIHFFDNQGSYTASSATWWLLCCLEERKTVRLWQVHILFFIIFLNTWCDIQSTKGKQWSLLSILVLLPQVLPPCRASMFSLYFLRDIVYVVYAPRMTPKIAERKSLTEWPLFRTGQCYLDTVCCLSHFNFAETLKGSIFFSNIFEDFWTYKEVQKIVQGTFMQPPPRPCN